MSKEVYIVSAVRTALGSFGGTLASVSATKLGAAAIKGALAKINLDGKEVQDVLMGCVLQGNLGQAPARQAAMVTRKTGKKIRQTSGLGAGCVMDRIFVCRLFHADPNLAA